MSLDVLAHGKLRAPVELRTSLSGKAYVRFKMHALDKKGNTVPVNCVSFLPSVLDKVKDLVKGDSIAVSGEIEISVWKSPDGIDHHGLDMSVNVVMTAYHAAMRRADRQQANEDHSTAGDQA